MTAGFADKPFEERLHSVGGDWAEAACEDLFNARNVSYQRFGFDRTDLKNFYLLPLFVRKTPDYLVTTDKEAFAVECKGCGKGDHVNLSMTAIEGMQMWNLIIPLYLFLNDSERDCYVFVKFDDVALILADKMQYTTGQWSDGVKFAKIPKALFTWTPK